MNKFQASLVLGLTLGALSVVVVSSAYLQRPSGTTVAFSALVIFLTTVSAISALNALSKFAPGSRWMKLCLAFTFVTVAFIVVVLIIAVLRARLPG